MVLAPRGTPSPARSMAACISSKSTPLCWQKRPSSETSTARTTLGEMASMGIHSCVTS
jgi:hypothetical protein